MTIARACRPPAQAFCRRLAGPWWIVQHPPRVLYLCFACVRRLMSRTGTDQRYEQAVSVTDSLHNGR